MRAEIENAPARLALKLTRTVPSPRTSLPRWSEAKRAPTTVTEAPRVVLEGLTLIDAVAASATASGITTLSGRIAISSVATRVAIGEAEVRVAMLRAAGRGMRAASGIDL